MRASETAAQDLKMIFWNLGLRVNYYYPPDRSFAAANGKNLLDEESCFKFLSE
jgi:hypothetical protein